ncbi:MAG: hypothetical protein A2017_19300 [Lentisphaerae bacterium GWF2_44_16]|nr:MAG: hypothetical protein A2017_19300 [Lentisphaerae bacterium GWF2_44_16]
MKTQIFYFSGTGNSLSVARVLAGKLEDTQIVSIPIALKHGIQPECDCLGIVYPVYAFGIPLIVAKFLKQLSLSNDAYIFAVCTYAGLAGKSLLLANSFLQKRNLTLSSGFMVKMPGNYIPFGGAPSKVKQEKEFAEAERRLSGIAEIVKSGKKIPLERNFIPPLWLSRLIFSYCKKEASYVAIKNFRSDEKCNACGLCAKVCQTENIVIKNGKPLWGNHCEQCMACLQWCPREAIQYGKHSARRKRYQHPGVKARELFIEQENSGEAFKNKE